MAGAQQRGSMSAHQHFEVLHKVRVQTLHYLQVMQGAQHRQVWEHLLVQ
jgi:hypothetical protein